MLGYYFTTQSKFRMAENIKNLKLSVDAPNPKHSTTQPKSPNAFTTLHSIEHSVVSFCCIYQMRTSGVDSAKGWGGGIRVWIAVMYSYYYCIEQSCILYTSLFDWTINHM